jgi:hypothetical protein
MLDERYIVEKSKALVWAQFQDYSSGELKILDTYLSRIDARNPDSSLVTFTKKEYAELMGLDSDIRTEQLKAYTGGLLSNVVTIEMPGKGYVQYPLFSEAKCYLDETSGQVTIEVDCNHKLKPAFFDLAKNGYVRYQLKNIISLKSQYSVRLYPKLKDRPFGWTVAVSELREILGATAASYNVFKDFNKHVLQKAIKEINEITDIYVTTENIRKGKSVVSIKFSVTEKSPHVISKEEAELYDDAEHVDVVIDEGQMTFGEVMDDAFVDESDDPLAFFASALPPNFNREQVELLRSLAYDHKPSDVAYGSAADLWLHDYLSQKTKLMQATTGVMNPFGWMRRAVMEDWK